MTATDGSLGNLLDDGVRTYDYDNANRLIAVVSGTLTTTYIYNGDGHRMAKAKNGVTTSYVVAVLGLSQVLVETTGGDSILYLYGHDLLGEKDDTWQWHLGDGLGSVRQLIDSGGGVSLAQGYTPFGVPLWSEGGGTTGYGFTGERWEAYSQLLFLRARYYDPGIGRFVSRDPWPGSGWRPQALNGWSYVENAPTNLIDPSGYSSASFSPRFSFVFMGMAAGPAVELVRSVYSKAGMLYVCALHPDDGQRPTDEVGDLLLDYVCEYGEAQRDFQADAHLTQQLAKSYTIHRLREEFYQGGCQDLAKEHSFGISEFLWATIDTLLESDWVFDQGPPLNVTHFLGTFDCRITRSSSDKVRFWIHNATELASGSRIPPILGGVDPNVTKDWTSVEKILEENPLLWPAPLMTIIDFYPVLSILEPRLREETGGFLDLEGGGTMEQIFVWQEQSFACGLPSWPGIQSELEIR
jgi:RHS repeat-associated protein